MSIVKQKLDWIADLQTRQLVRIHKHQFEFMYERLAIKIEEPRPPGFNQQWQALAYAEYDDGVLVSATATVVAELLRVERDYCSKALKSCKKAIEAAIYNEDGLDGAEGQDVLLAIAGAQAMLEDAE